MNKASRLFGSVALAAGLTLGGSVTAGAAFADGGDNHRSSYDRDRDGRDWRDRDGYDRSGYNHDGYNRSGYDRDGYARDGYDCNGYDRRGNDRHGHHRNHHAWYTDRYGNVHYIIYIVRY